MDPRIEKMREIVKKWDELQLEINEVASDKLGKIPTVTSKFAVLFPNLPAKRKGKKGKRIITCKKCGEPGHIAKTCTSGTSFSGGKKGTRAAPTCSKCGKVGHRSHLCPQTDLFDEKKDEPFRDDGTVKLTDAADKVLLIKGMQAEGRLTSIEEIAEHFNLNEDDAKYLMKKAKATSGPDLL